MPHPAAGHHPYRPQFGPAVPPSLAPGPLTPLPVASSLTRRTVNGIRGARGGHENGPREAAHAALAASVAGETVAIARGARELVEDGEPEAPGAGARPELALFPWAGPWRRRGPKSKHRRPLIVRTRGEDEKVQAVTRLCMQRLAATPGNASGSGEGYRNVVRALSAYLLDMRDPFGATEATVQAWAYDTGASGRRPSAATVANRLWYLSCWYRAARSLGLVALDPTVEVPRPRRPPLLPRGLDHEERLRLIAACPPTPLGLRDRAIIVTALTTGLRRRELAALTVGCILMRNGTPYYEVKVKGGGVRRRQMPAAALEAIRLAWRVRLAADRSELPNAWRARPVGARELEDMPASQRLFGVDGRAIRWAIARRGKAAGLRIGAHTLRHAAAWARHDAGCSAEDVQALLGHVSEVYTRRYLVRLTGEDDPGAEAVARELGL